ncbi:MAG: hypothetical protein OWU33_00145 [Firmicutes bacterium]|nr:hypothetical protein [Bacillota bacterium]
MSNLTSLGQVNVAIRVWTPTRIEAFVPKTVARGLYTPELWTATGTPVGPGSDAAWPIFRVTDVTSIVSG